VTIELLVGDHRSEAVESVSNPGSLLLQDGPDSGPARLAQGRRFETLWRPIYGV
jgi:hypothetical protein